MDGPDGCMLPSTGGWQNLLHGPWRGGCTAPVTMWAMHCGFSPGASFPSGPRRTMCTWSLRQSTRQPTSVRAQLDREGKNHHSPDIGFVHSHPKTNGCNNDRDLLLHPVVLHQCSFRSLQPCDGGEGDKGSPYCPWNLPRVCCCIGRYTHTRNPSLTSYTALGQALHLKDPGLRAAQSTP